MVPKAAMSIRAIAHCGWMSVMMMPGSGADAFVSYPHAATPPRPGLAHGSALGCWYRHWRGAPVLPVLPGARETSVWLSML